MVRLFALASCFWLMACASPPYDVVTNDSHPGMRTIIFDDFALTLPDSSWNIAGQLSGGKFYNDRFGGYTGYLIHDEYKLEFTVQAIIGCGLAREANSDDPSTIWTSGYNTTYQIQGSYSFLANTNGTKVHVHLCVAKQSFSRSFYVEGVLNEGAKDKLVQILKTVHIHGSD